MKIGQLFMTLGVLMLMTSTTYPANPLLTDWNTGMEPLLERRGLQ